MSFQLLVSCVAQDVHMLAEKMRISSDAIIINQKSEYCFEEFAAPLNGNSTIQSLSMNEKGVGLSRNTALQRASADIVLFGDEDIVYEDDYARLVTEEFDKHPGADIILFNVKVSEKRRTYWNETEHAVHRWNCARYPAYSVAARREKLHEACLCFHLWFGGGAIFSNGEDSLFINDALKAGLKLYAVTTCIGEEVERENSASTWFDGYNEKFFYDRGVLYHYLYGKLAWVMMERFLLRNKSVMCKQIPYKQAKALMKKGMKLRKPFSDIS